MAVRVCPLEDIVPNTGVAALVDGEQVAVFRLDDDSVHAVGNRDPFSRANVLSRGIVGDLKGELVVASPVYKQHFNLRTGRCVEDASARIPVYAARVEDGWVVVEPRKQVATTCCYCGVGCGMVVSTHKNGIFSVKGDAAHPANHGRLCTKGAALHLSTDAGARLLYPEVERRARRAWDEALDHAAERFRQIIAAHGPDAVAFYISGQLLTEDYYVFNKLAKGLIGTNNVDTNSRLCMSSAVAGYKQSLGADAPPCAYEDIDAADLILIAGSNTAFAHPILYRRIEEARAREPGAQARRHRPARAPSPRAPPTCISRSSPAPMSRCSTRCCTCCVRKACSTSSYIEEHTENFENSKRSWTTGPRSGPPRSATCPWRRSSRRRACSAASKAALSLYCQGLNQSASGTWKNCALINLHLATGQIGKPGAGPFSLTGQPNAMGGREVGGMANLLSGHRDLDNEEHRKEVAALWGVDAVPAKPGKTAVEMFEAIGRGEIKAVWIACTNPAQSMPDANAVRKALERAEFVVVQEAFRDAETCDYADVLLPAATWGEKEGTVTNSERRISRVRAAVPPPGEARPDWQIAVDFARRLGCPAGEKLFPYARHPKQIFNEHRESTRGRDLDITGLSYARARARRAAAVALPGRRQGAAARASTPTASSRRPRDARASSPPNTCPPAEEPDAQFPLRLTTGRLRDQWHSMTRTGLVARLFSHSPEPEIVVQSIRSAKE